MSKSLIDPVRVEINKNNIICRISAFKKVHVATTDYSFKGRTLDTAFHQLHISQLNRNHNEKSNLMRIMVQFIDDTHETKCQSIVDEWKWIFYEIHADYSNALLEIENLVLDRIYTRTNRQQGVPIEVKAQYIAEAFANAAADAAAADDEDVDDAYTKAFETEVKAQYAAEAEAYLTRVKARYAAEADEFFARAVADKDAADKDEAEATETAYYAAEAEDDAKILAAVLKTYHEDEATAANAAEAADIAEADANAAEADAEDDAAETEDEYDEADTEDAAAEADAEDAAAEAEDAVAETEDEYEDENDEGEDYRY
jgi:hypothetical protein